MPGVAPRSSLLRCLSPSYRGVLWLAIGWTLLTTFYVYFVLDGARTHRIESAALVLAVLLVPLVMAGRRDDLAITDLSPGHLTLVVVVVSGLFLATYAPLLTFPFLSDDYVFLKLYRSIHDVLYAPQFFRPMFATVFLTLAHIGNGSPVPFHVLSSLLHGVSAFFVYSLSRQLFGSSAPALAAFVVFLLNPLQLEAVLWPSGMQELLWTSFTLGALRLYLATQRLSPWRIAGTLLLLVCALLSKETAICFVLLLPVGDLVYFRMRRGPALLPAYAVFAAAAVGYLLVRRQFVAATPDNIVTLSRYFVKQFVSAPYKVFVQPWNAVTSHVPSAVAGVVSLVFIALASLVAVVRGSSPRLLYGPALILISTLPLQGYFFVGADLAGARYLYFANAGWAMLVAELVASTITRDRLFVLVVAAIALASVLSLHVNLRPWRVAGDIVDHMKVAVERGEPTTAVVAAWQDKLGGRLELTNGVPRAYQGVSIFNNGYAEFVDMTRQQD